MALNIDFKTFTTGKYLHPLARPNLMLFAGPIGSGKSTTMLNVLNGINKESDDLEEVFYFTANKKDKLLNVLGKDVQIESDIGKLSNLYANIKSESQSPHRVIIIDDCACFKKMFGLSWFIDMVMSLRHHNIQLLITTQGYHMIHKQVRSQATMIYIYPTRNSKQRKDIIEEMPIDPSKMNEFLNLIEHDTNRNFLYINLQELKPRVFKNFDVQLY